MRFRMLPGYLGSSLLLVASTIIVASSIAHAATVPEVVINGVQGGRIVSADGMVQFTGIARDPEGINRINAQLKFAQKNIYLLPNGTWIKKSRNIPVQFQTQAGQTPWSTSEYQVPEGEYVFILQLVDNAGTRTQVFEVPVGVGAVAAAAAGQSNAVVKSAAGANTAANAIAPRVAINFPKNGSAIKGRAVFSGIAKDDGAVARVVATIMNAENGQFLAPNGRFGQRTELALQNSGGSNAQWSSPPIQLPPGKYVLAVRGVDNGKKAGGWTQSEFTVVGANSNAAVEAKPVASTAAPIVATSPATPAAPAPNVGKAANGMSYCGNASQDADGDGFGWENENSCVVTGSRADTHPNCASAGSDPDGDGYGWENERSCIVVAHCGSANSDPDGDGFGWENDKSCVVLKAAGRFPKCTSTGSDPDGDGYGWENNKTCLIN